MKHKDIQPLIQQTAKILNYDPEVVKDVVSSQFKFLFSNLNAPAYPRIRLEHIGKFETTTAKVEHRIKSLILRLRKYPDKRDEIVPQIKLM